MRNRKQVGFFSAVKQAAVTSLLDKVENGAESVVERLTADKAPKPKKERFEGLKAGYSALKEVSKRKAVKRVELDDAIQILIDEHGVEAVLNSIDSQG